MSGHVLSLSRVPLAALAIGALLISGCGSAQEETSLEMTESVLVDIKPVDSGRLSSRFGWRSRHPILRRPAFHAGIDWAAPTGTPVRAAAHGRVISARDSYGGYGRYLRLYHEGRIETVYAHLSRIEVPLGAKVRRGQIIGRVGRTGRVTGPHLHFELRVAGRPIDPLKAASYAMAPPLDSAWTAP